jgi:site-specific recombinase XerD
MESNMHTRKAITAGPAADLAHLNNITTQAGQAANEQAERTVFARHEAAKSPQTVRRNRADIAVFEGYLQSVGVPATGLYDNPHAWRDVTWGLVEGFKIWQIQQGYAIGSINIRLSTVRMFSELAAKSGVITAQESILIASVKGYAPQEGRHVDEKRRADGMDTRKGAKKAEAVIIPDDIAQALKAQADTPQGRRDNLIMCLLLDHGLRVVELLGRHAGIEGLSAHDARHHWATYEANHGTQVNRLMDAGGWSSPAMPLRYIQTAQIANEGTARVKTP